MKALLEQNMMELINEAKKRLQVISQSIVVSDFDFAVYWETIVGILSDIFQGTKFIKSLESDENNFTVKIFDTITRRMESILIPYRPQIVLPMQFNDFIMLGRDQLNDLISAYGVNGIFDHVDQKFEGREKTLIKQYLYAFKIVRKGEWRNLNSTNLRYFKVGSFLGTFDIQVNRSKLSLAITRLSGALPFQNKIAEAFTNEEREKVIEYLQTLLDDFFKDPSVIIKKDAGKQYKYSQVYRSEILPYSKAMELLKSDKDYIFCGYASSRAIKYSFSGFKSKLVKLNNGIRGMTVPILSETMFKIMKSNVLKAIAVLTEKGEVENDKILSGPDGVD